MEREEREQARAASELVEKRRAERVRLEMERLKRVWAEKERREKARAAQRAAEEQERARREEEEAERRQAEREKRKSLEERVERTTGKREKPGEVPNATYAVASVASSLPPVEEAEVELELEVRRRQGAIPRRLASRGREERTPRTSPDYVPISPRANEDPEGEGRARRNDLAAQRRENSGSISTPRELSLLSMRLSR